MGLEVNERDLQEVLKPFIGNRRKLSLTDFCRYISNTPPAQQAPAIQHSVRCSHAIVRCSDRFGWQSSSLLAVSPTTPEAEDLSRAIEAFHGRTSELLKCMERYDADGDGLLAAEELRRAFAVTHFRVPLSTCKRIIRALDRYVSDLQL